MIRNIKKLFIASTLSINSVIEEYLLILILSSDAVTLIAHITFM